MLKAKGKVVSLLTACLTMLFALVLGFAALFAPTPITTANAATTTVTDKLTVGTTGATSTAYITWSGKDGGDSDAIYAGNSSKSTNGGIQMRSSNSNSGIVTTASGGTARKITVVWDKATTSGRILDIYGKDTAYSQATDLYKSDPNTKGTKLGSIKCGTSTELTISGDYAYIGLRSNSGAMYLTSITIAWEVATQDCTHEGGDWNYDAKTKEHYQICANCDAEMEGTRELCADYDDFEYGDWETANGTHTRNLICNLCGGKQTESGECNFSEPTIEQIVGAKKHKEIGTCEVCESATEVEVDCTLTYAYVSNNDKTHTMTSTCSVCEQSITTESVTCTFDEGILDGSTLTYTCEYCEYSYTEEVTTYTVEYVVPNSIEEIESVPVAENFSTVLPTAGAEEGYTFVGWTTQELDEKTEINPEFFAAGTEYTVTADVTLYALYSYAEGSGAWTKVTDVSTLEIDKEIVIAASSSAYALSTTQNSNNRKQASISKDGDTITWNTNDVQVITLEAGTVADTFAFNVGNGYLYAASSDKNYLRTQTTNNANGSWKITIANDGNATIVAQGSYTNNTMQYNSGSSLFSCYASASPQQPICIYMKDGATYYVTAFNTCSHANQTEVIEPATCTENGSRTVTCLDCESVIASEILPATGHNYVDDICESCGEAKPSPIATLTFDDASKRNGQVWNENGITLNYEGTANDYVKPARFYKNGSITISYGNMVKIEFYCNDEDYATALKNTIGENATIDGSMVIVTFDEAIDSYSVSALSAQVRMDSLTVYTDEIDSIKIKTASLSIGESLVLNYYVTLPAALKEAVMYFNFVGEDKAYDVTGVKQPDGRYTFSLKVPPQAMATNVKAELKFGDYTLDVMENYSVKTYAQNKLNATESSDELKRLVSDILYYGAAAQTYKSYNTENLATDDVDNILDALEDVPTTTDFTLVNEKVKEYPVYFKGANLWFGDVNQIRITLSSYDENVSLTVNEEEVELVGDTYLTDGILATEFDTTYTFVLSYNGVVMQTLTYSINAFAYAKKDSTSIGELALALYRYGKSAVAYNNAQ